MVNDARLTAPKITNAAVALTNPVEPSSSGGTAADAPEPAASVTEYRRRGFADVVASPRGRRGAERIR